MILHCKNAEMAIYCHTAFLQFKIIQFSYFPFFFKSGSFFTAEEIQKVKTNFFFFFSFFLLKCKNLGRRIRKPRNKKNRLTNQ